MAHLLNSRLGSVLRRVFSNLSENRLSGSVSKTPNPRFYGRKKLPETCGGENLTAAAKDRARRAERANKRKRAAQDALLDYLHSNRNLRFLDAENMSRNSPRFLNNLLEQLKGKRGIGEAMELLLSCQPINEFEPFFESLGLKCSEYAPLLPQGVMFLTDDALLLDNYHVLCDYGLEPKEIGRIFKVLQSKLLAYEEVGLSKSTVAKLVASFPDLLIADVYVEAAKVLEKLKGVDFTGIRMHLSKWSSCNWGQVLDLRCLLMSKVGFSDGELDRLFSQHPGLFFQRDWTLVLIGFLLKCGFTRNQIYLLLKQFPQVQVEKFVSNLRHCYHFLNDIGMESEEIGNIVQSHTLLLGSCNLKKTSSIMTTTEVGEKRIRNCVMGNPLILKNFIRGLKTEPWPSSRLSSRRQRIKFLKKMGFEKNSDEMTKMLKRIQGKGGDLKERFVCIARAGLKQKDVAHMVKRFPQMINLTKGMLQTKIDVLVNEMCFPISSVLRYPSYFGINIQRVKLRFAMYNWLKEQGCLRKKPTLRHVLARPDKYFVSKYVTRHPKGLQVWEDLRCKYNLKH